MFWVTSKNWESNLDGECLYRSEEDADAEKRLIFNYEVNQESFCCGIRELCQFTFGQIKGDEIKEVFTAITEHFKENAKENRYAFAHLTLLREKDYTGSKFKAKYPGWFMLFLKQYPGAVHSEWRINPNTGNKLQFWVLPV